MGWPLNIRKQRHFSPAASFPEQVMTTKNPKRHNQEWFGNPIDDVGLTIVTGGDSHWRCTSSADQRECSAERIVRRCDAQRQFPWRKSD
jgi:hypothetical protein